MAIALLIFGVIASTSTMVPLQREVVYQRPHQPTAEMLNQDPNIVSSHSMTVNSARSVPAGASRAFLALVIGSFVLIGTILGWKNVLRLRNASPPRSGLVAASIAALLPLFIPLWLIIAVNVRNETLAWLDGITITAILLFWFGCWVNPLPRPWSAKAVVGIAFIFVPILFIAHGWGDYHERIEIRWAQEMNRVQEKINDLERENRGSLERERLVESLRNLHLSGPTTIYIGLSSRERALLALSLLFAVLGTVLGWMARADMLKEPGTQRGLAMAKFAAYFWPIGIVPLGLLLLA